MKTLLHAFFAVAGICAMPGVVTAQALLFDFGPTTITAAASKQNSPGHAAGDLGPTALTWNQIQLVDISSGLKFADGTAAAGVGIDLGVETTSSSNIIGFGTQPSSSLQGNNGAYSTGIYTADSPARDFIYNSANNEPWAIGARVSGLAPGVYRVYINGGNVNAASAGTMNFYAAAVGTGAAIFDFTGAATRSATNLSAGAAQWTEGVNYVVFSISVTAVQDLVIAASSPSAGANGRGFLNSLEVVWVSPIPEPGSFASVAGLAALGFCSLRRRGGRA